MQETSKLPRGSEESRGETPKPHESSVVSAADADVPDHPLEEPRALSEAGQRYRLAKQLRERTGRSAIQCRRALEVHGDDLERAAAWLHTQGTPDAISLLREQTGSSQVLCQIALDRCQGDMGRAAEWLEKDARDERWLQSWQARRWLHTMRPDSIEQHVDDVVAMLVDEYYDGCTRVLALETLGKLEPATLAQHTHAVVARLYDRPAHVRRAALLTLGKLGPANLAPHAALLVK